MSPPRILAAATAIECCFLMAGLAVLGIGGAWSNLFDLLNCAAPLFLAVACGSALAAHGILEPGWFRRVCVAAALLAALFNLGLIAPELAALASRPRAAAANPYRLVTANAFHANDGPFHASRDIIGRGADAVLLQEADGTIARAHWVFSHDYPYSSHCPAADVRIWTKTSILAQGCGLPLPPGAPAAWGQDFVWIRTLAPDGRPVILATVHMPHPYPTDRQAVERRAMAAALAQLPPGDLILTGDFNTTPWTFTMQGQDRLLAPLRRRTLFWWTWPAQINLLSRPWSLPFLPIDHIYAGSHWGRVALTRFRVAGSDHFATEAVLHRAR